MTVSHKSRKVFHRQTVSQIGGTLSRGQPPVLVWLNHAVTIQVFKIFAVNSYYPRRRVAKTWTFSLANKHISIVLFNRRTGRNEKNKYYSIQNAVHINAQ